MAWSPALDEGGPHQFAEGSARRIGNVIDRDPPRGIGEIVIQNEARIVADCRLVGRQPFIEKLGRIDELGRIRSALAHEGICPLPGEGVASP